MKPRPKWVARAQPAQEEVDRLCTELKVKPHHAILMAHRGLLDLEAAKAYFNPEAGQLHDPYSMKGMEQAVARLHQAIEQGEKILVYGDYDVDGTTAVSLVYTFLRSFYENVLFYIPDRQKEGYGVSLAGIDYAEEQGASLIIALDCGIKAVKQVDYACEKDIDFIICDHHKPGTELPKCVAILNPKQDDCDYPYKELSGCAIGFKLIQAYSQQHRPAEDLTPWCDLVATSVACDIVPITGENRLLAHLGIKQINDQPRPGIQALMNVAGCRKVRDVTDLVFKLGPRINAVGRLAHAHEAVKLLACDDHEAALDIAMQVNQKNAKRKDLDNTVTEQALQMVAEDDFLRNASGKVLFNPEWHKGVIGIVASRVVEEYYRPTILLTESNGKAVGSARSVAGFSIYEALERCDDLLEQFGGHMMAAGMTLPLENVEAFRHRFAEVVEELLPEELRTPVLEYDLELGLDEVNMRLINSFERFGPFGPENMRPVLVTHNVRNAAPPRIVGERHLSLMLEQEKTEVLRGIFWGQGSLEPELRNAKEFSVCYSLEVNEYRGYFNPQAVIKDIIIPNRDVVASESTEERAGE